MARKKTKTRNSNPLVTAVVANARGEIFELEGYAAVGMAGESLAPLTARLITPLPHGGELMFLPDRSPVLLNLETNRIETVSRDPYAPDAPLFPVAAFNSPGYVNTHACAYEENGNAGFLPLFAYGAVGWHQDGFASAVYRVDTEKRQDLRYMAREKVVAGVSRMQKRMPDNRLRRHLEKCALTYGCPAAKNFFIGRFEAPLPTARTCNANCIGCISQQKDSDICSPQDRIDFTPTPDEIAEVALAHIARVKRSVVSFGQGCEGDPLLAADSIGPAIRKIRLATSAGTINMNTNGSRPDILERLIADGLESIRISMNSTREACYEAYFRPSGYKFTDVVKSIDLALKNGLFVSINYLNCPGVTDAPEEAAALAEFLHRHPVNMIQWRNLNFDPLRYWRHMKAAAPLGPPIGMRHLIRGIGKQFPDILFGYFNPPRDRFRKIFKDSTISAD